LEIVVDAREKARQQIGSPVDVADGINTLAGRDPRPLLR
jgi:hypothetical protein